MTVHVVNRVLFALHEGTMHWCVTVPAFNIIFKIFMQLVAVVFKF
jgi:hypothetical protein